MEKLVDVMDIGYEDNQVSISFAEPEEAEDCFVYDDELSDGTMDKDGLDGNGRQLFKLCADAVCTDQYA